MVMEAPGYLLIRTVRVSNENVPGVLGALATAIGKAGANIGNIETVHISQNHVVRDVDISVTDEAQLEHVLEAIASVVGVEVLETRDEVLTLHQGGKIQMVSRYPVDSLATLRKVYTPGVAEVCRRIAERPDRRRLYTAIQNMIAIVTDGSAVLGLGNIGVGPAMPVMEGKAALLHQLVGVSGVPILVDSQEPDDIVEAVVRIAPTFGGIHLEDIASPKCFDIVDRLRKRLKIPVMQDDQDGTAAVALGAVLSAMRATQRDIQNQVIGQIGLGAAGTAIASLLMHVTGKPVLGADINEASLDRLSSLGGTPSTLDEIMAKADLVIATTGVKGLIKPGQVRKGQIVFALSNPDPEIDPAEALERGAILAADGRSVNNVLGYPGIWRGVLTSQATEINRDMLVAAGKALAEMTSPGEVAPYPLDLRVHRRVAYVVAQAAVRVGVGSPRGVEELEPYAL